MNVKSWGLRHAQTLVGSLGRLAQQPLATLMTIGVIAVALALPLLLGIFLQNVRAATANWNQAFDLSVYMDKKTTAARLQATAKQLRTRPEIDSVRVITADQALEDFRRTSGFGEALEALDGNPLPDTLIVTPRARTGTTTPEAIEALRAFIARLPDVQTVQIDSQWVKRLQSILGLVRRIVLLAGVLLGVGIVLVVGNTIRLDILNRRSEIEVMKLVGATDGFARRPFLYSGLWYGLGGGVLALLLVGAVLIVVAGPAQGLARLYGSEFRLAGPSFGAGIGVLGLAMALSWLGSWMSATRQIRRIEPN